MRPHVTNQPMFLYSSLSPHFPISLQAGRQATTRGERGKGRDRAIEFGGERGGGHHDAEHGRGGECGCRGVQGHLHARRPLGGGSDG